MIIANPKGLSIRPEEAELIASIETLSGLDRAKLERFRLTSAYRPKDAYGFHREGLAVDVACDVLPLMLELYEALKAAKWPGGLGLAGPGVPLHIHADARQRKSYPPAYFYELKDGQKFFYPSQQVTAGAYAKYTPMVQRCYR